MHISLNIIDKGREFNLMIRKREGGEANVLYLALRSLECFDKLLSLRKERQTQSPPAALFNVNTHSIRSCDKII